MAERLAYLEAVVGADITQFRKGMRDIRNEVGLLSETMSGISAVGRTLTFAFTVPAITLGTYAVQAAAGFEEAMRNVNSIAHLTDEEFQQLSDQVLEFGNRTRGGATEAAEGLYTVMSAGITDASVALGVMEIATATAEAGLSDLSSTTEALVGSFLAFNGDALSVTDQLIMMQQHSDALTQMVQIGVGTMDEFANAVGQVVPTAVALDIGIEDLYGTMAYLTQRGLNASKASVALNGALNALLKPSEAMNSAFQQLGVTTGDELIEQFGGLEGALQAVIGTTDGSADALTALFQDVRGFRAIGLLAEDMEGWSTALDDFRMGMDGATDRARAEQLKSFAASWDLLMASLQGVGIAIGNVLLPVLQPLVDGVTDFLNEISETNPEVLALITGFVGLAAAAAPVLWVLGSMANPLAAIIVAVGALATAFAVDFGGIRETVHQAVEDIFGDLSALEGLFEEAFSIIFPSSQEEMNALAEQYLPPPAEVTPTRFVVLDTNTTAEELFEPWKDKFTYEEFLEITGLSAGATLEPGDVVMIPDTARQDLLNTLRDGMQLLPESVQDAILENPVVVTAAEFFHVDLEGLDHDLEVDLLDRLRIAADQVGAKISTVLQPMLDHAREWLDTKVGEGLNWLAGLFQPVGKDGNTPVYQALTSLLEGDITGAINDIVPGLGTNLGGAIGGWADDIRKAFPQIEAGLKNLLGQMGDWIVNTGVPTLSRSLGHLSGALAAGLYDAVGNAVEFFTSGAAGDTANAVGDFVDGSIAAPFAAGFQDALAGTNLQTEGIPAVEQAIQGIADTFETIGITDLVESFGTLGSGIADFANDLATADWSGVGELLNLALQIAGFVSMLRLTVLTGVIEGIGAGLPILGDAIKNIVNAIAMIGDKPIGDILKELGQGIVNIALALLQIPAGIIDEIIQLFERITGLDIQLPDLTDAITRWAEDVNTAFDNVVVDPVVMVAPGRFTYDAAADPTRAGLNIFGEEIRAQIETYLAEHPVQIGDAPLDITINPGQVQFDPGQATANLFQLPGVQAQAPASGVEVTITPGTTVTVAGTNNEYGTDFVVPNSSAAAQVGNLTVDTTNAQATLTGGEEVIEQAVLPDGEMEQHIATQIDQAASAAAVQLANTFMVGGVVDPNVIVENFLVPLETSWNEYLGTEGKLQTTMTEFATHVGTKTGEAATDFDELKTNVETNFPAMVTRIEADTDTMIEIFEGVKLVVDGMTLAFTALYDAATLAGSAMAAVGLGGGDGSSAPSNNRDGGQMMAGEASWVGEEGAEIWVPNTAGTIIPHDVATGIAQDYAGGSVVYQNVTINEANNLDQILYEARRRGINL
jgi:TP901 family phage tail tape measure protein